MSEVYVGVGLSGLSCLFSRWLFYADLKDCIYLTIRGFGVI